MQIFLEKLSIVKIKKHKTFFVDFNVNTTFRLFKFSKKNKCFEKKYNCV